MIQSKQSITGFRILALSTIVLFSVAAFSGCTKKTDSDAAAKFVGTWNGASSCGGTDPLVFGSGGANKLTLTGSAGSGSCATSITATINVSGSTITMPTQTLTDLCGVSYTVSGSGSLSGTILIFTENLSSSIGNASCTFSGTK